MGSFNDKREYAKRRVSEFHSEIRKSKPLNDQKGLSLYVTGSFARGEAGEHSDIDLFLITDSAFQPSPVTKQDLTLIHADLHNAAVGLGFPPFSKDMEYLKPHRLEEILLVLGSPADDFYNHFTARMLLLLESKCIFNEMVYENSITEIILAYYRDYHDHREEFFPLFLVNDIHRYWRTICLNYEHNRNMVPASGDDKQEVPCKEFEVEV